MLDKRQRRMTPEEFYAWAEPLDEKYELVDGYPVKRCPDARMMTGASKRHDRIVWNLIRVIGNQLGDGPRQGFTSDTAIRTSRQFRRPDAGIECGSRDDQSHEAEDVRFVAEVLSPSTREFDMFGKVEEYKSVPSMLHILLIGPNAPLAILWTRQEGGTWASVTLEGEEVDVDMPALNVRFALGEIYGNLTFRAIPKLVEGRVP